MSSDKVRIAVVGAAGAFGMKHLDGLKNIEDAVVTVVSATSQEKADAVAAQYGVPNAVVGLDAVLERDDVDAVILATPTGLHASQTQAVLAAGKHVQVEIPLADSFADAEAAFAAAEAAEASGKIAMVGHTRRFNPSHQLVHNKITAGEFNVQQMDVQTYFFRRSNTNAKGEPRSWTDHLLWHHAAHTVDLFAYQAGKIVQANAIQGPIHPDLGIAMDMSIQLKSETGAICTLSLSFNNEGPFGTFFRYIGDTATYVARYDDLYDGNEQQIDVTNVAVSMNGIELQDREFVAAIREGREPNSSVRQVLDCYRVLGMLEEQLA
ncbi:Gfo/Idh/MocA family oxidoreductase [Leucobacter sp. W1478]|uniref:Gfo/Idh/MocA family oxidoreductase n=1 Tax=Leucobacter sp. W1478 TaxID=3439065 RepID=UPI003F37CFE8